MVLENIFCFINAINRPVSNTRTTSLAQNELRYENKLVLTCMLLQAEHFFQEQNDCQMSLFWRQHMIYVAAQKDKKTKKDRNTKRQKGMKDEKTER